MIYQIILIGPQGSGKGTQAELIARKFSIPRIETGSLWRKEIENGTELGKKQIARQKQGQLASDEDTAKLVKERLEESDAQNGFLFDGYPRNQVQVKDLDALTGITDVLVLNLSEEESIKRIMGRLFCKKCGRSYHVVYNPPVYQYGEKWLCDEDKQELIVRDDDKEEAIKQRLKIYHEQTEPLIEIYRQRGLVHEINASKSIEETHQDILRVLEK